MKKSIGIISALCLGISAFGQNINDPDPTANGKHLQLNTITTAVPFLIITPDSRSGAMGDVGAGLSPDANSIHWNTSKLVFSKEKAEFSASYSPWLRQLVDDIHLSYIAGYTKLGDQHAIGGSIRYFSLGNITFTDNIGNVIRDFNPNEFEVTGAYAFRLSERNAIGINGKFVYSNLTGGTNVGNVGSKAGVAGAVDVSYSWFNPDIRVGDKDATLSLATTISNIGNKIAYTVDSERDFLPTNLRLGSAFKVEFDKYNSLTTAVDFNKLLVPSPPVYDGDGNLVSGKDPEVGVVTGMIQSFYDAPGDVSFDENGDPSIKKNSRFGEEMREINFGVGLEYWYSSILAVRTGYFHEHYSKGNRRYLTFGAGIYFGVFGLDVSYLASVTQNNPLANTVRFSLKFKFGDKKATDNPSVDD
ncbi:MAG: type IX secretion system outer membrane channel protein PorV [Crocinitomicaceae bacterium]|nr:type IX secretion system outer membrane channel protein PorV [Crocinitomicaceae bacterium]